MNYVKNRIISALVGLKILCVVIQDSVTFVVANDPWRDQLF